MPQHPWLEARVSELREMWEGGLSAGAIAHRFCKEGFQITRSAVIGKVYRLGLGRRVTRIKYFRSGTELAMDGSRAPRRNEPVKRHAPRPSIQTMIEARPIVTFHEPKVYGITGGPFGCSWIEGDVATPGWHYCNAPKAKGPYCAGHAVLCYRPEEARPDRRLASSIHD